MARARAMCLRASDTAGHHGLDIMDGGTVDALWAAARVSLGSPHIWSDRRRSRFRGSAFHRRCCLPAYQMWVLNLRRNALSGLQNGRRGPSRRFPVERDRDCRKPGEIADLTLSSGRGPGRVSPQVSITSWKCAKNQVVVQRKCAQSSWR